MELCKLVKILTILSLVSCNEASHFRGAIVMFHMPNYITEAEARASGIPIIINYRIGWRRSYSGNLYCDEGIITNGTKLLTAGTESLACRTGCSGSLADMTFYCTDFSVSEDWSFGEKTKENTLPYPTGGIVEASYTGGDWISMVTGGGNWEIRLAINMTKILTERGKNASPISKMAPILRLQTGCNHTVQIPVEDADGDNIRCRWATAARSECAGVCQTFPGATLDERTCVLSYPTGSSNRIGYYAVALQIEDFLNPIDTHPFSSVPLQFLVLLFSSTGSCYSKPTFTIPPTRHDQSCVGIAPNTTFSEHVMAQAGGGDVSIVDIGTQSPPGMLKSPLAACGDNRWCVNITWTPTMNQYGPNLFCYSAKDSGGQTSDQICITLLGGVTPPRVKAGSMYPTGLVHPEQSIWKIEFDRDIYRPKRSAKICFHDTTGQKSHCVDTAFSPTAQFPDPQVSRILEFKTNYRFVEKAKYFVTLDNGVAIGKEFCGPESIKEYDPQFWQLTIMDVTPPKITYIANPDSSNNTVNITWTYDEYATTVCLLQAPSANPVAVTCNSTFISHNLIEGWHILYIQASDTAGNSIQYTHRWYVDLVKPTVTIANRPGSYSNKTNWTFSFRCTDRSTCKYKCKGHAANITQQFTDCGSTLTMNQLIEAEYVVSVYAIDGVGNVGDVSSYKWLIDTQSPQLQSLNNKTVMCGDPISPNELGYPIVTDNIDANPLLNYSDKATTGCTTTRTWVATDHAGNQAIKFQVIEFSNTVAPLVSGMSPLYVPCGNTDSVLFSPKTIVNALNISHACNRTTNVTFDDSRPVDACGIQLTRTWVITDDCGRTTTFIQDIQILQQSFPIAPENGQLNVDVNQYLEWPQYPGAKKYEVFLWQYGSDKPNVPLATDLTSRTFRPVALLPPTTQILWQVVYIMTNASGFTTRIPGPYWGFTTRAFLDLAVTDVSIPSQAFSGSKVSLSWTIENIGNKSTALVSQYWYDAIYLSIDRQIKNNRLKKLILQQRIVDAQDAYMDHADIELEDNEIGTFYVSIIVDVNRQLAQDFDYANNLKFADIPLKVELTPPPNLQVYDVYTLGTSYSGQQTIINHKVINVGFGITGSDRWYDAIYLSLDDILDSTDILLSRVLHSGALISQAKYEKTSVIPIPNGIYGNYSIIVQVDSSANVYEHANENDNIKAAVINVILSPTPDFVIQTLNFNDSVITGDELLIRYTVENKGAGAPYEGWWQDSVTITSVSNRQVYFQKNQTFTAPMSPSESYDGSVKYIIPVDLPSATFNVTIHTDSSNRVLEFDADNNNYRWKSFSLQRQLSNLVITQKTLRASSNVTGNYLNANITVANTGPGRVFGITSEDRVYLSTDVIGSPGLLPPVYIWKRTQNIQSLESYQLLLHDINIPPDINGNVHVYVSIDTNSVIAETNENDNWVDIGTVEVTKRVVDLAVTDASLGSSEIMSGSQVMVNWTVQNIGNLTFHSDLWEDAVYLARSVQSTDRQALNVSRVSRQDALLPGAKYSNSLFVNIPITSVGPVKIIIIAAQKQTSYEENYQNNIYSLDFEIISPPSSDLTIESVTHSFVSSGSERDARIIKVVCSVRNRGNTLGVRTWSDMIGLREVSSEQTVNNRMKTIIERSSGLVASDTYTLTGFINIPSDIYGFYKIVVSLDLYDDVDELNGELNNVRVSSDVIEIKRLPYPQLTISMTSNLPVDVRGGDMLQVQYVVTNVNGSNLILSSWTDAVYIEDNAAASRSQILFEGRLTGSTLQNLPLPVGGQYMASVDIRIPHGVTGVYYLYIITDMNNKLNFPHAVPYRAGSITISEAILPDLSVEMYSLPDLIQSGQDIDVQLKISNVGNTSADSVWYNSLYLSHDVIIDSFDVTLVTNRRPIPIAAGQETTETLRITIPFDLAEPNYYIIALVNADRRTLEVDYDNNRAHAAVSVESLPGVDLATLNVKASSKQAIYNDQISFTWNTMNNGSHPSKGYKCDTVYLSLDSHWQITDPALNKPLCNSFDLTSKNGSSSSLSNTATLPLVNVPEGNYSTLVRLRSSASDYNLNNNIGVSQDNIIVSLPTLQMGERKRYTVKENTDLVLKVSNVPLGIALLVTLKTTHEDAYHMLYLKRRQIPKQYDYDFSSDDRQFKEQYIVCPQTIGTSYYLLMESTGLSNAQYSIELEVKEAKFEITAVEPGIVAPFNTATIKFRGLLFGFKLKACLHHTTNSSVVICTERIYRYGAGLAYATFAVENATLGIYSASLQNIKNGEKVFLASAVLIAKEKPGYLTIDASMPGTLRAGQEGIIHIRMQNAGYSDIVNPIYAVYVTGESTTVRMSDTGDLIPPMAFYPFIPNVEEQPIGVFPPKANRQFQVVIKSLDATRASFRVNAIGEAQLKGYLSMMRHMLRSPTVSKVLWNIIWRNVDYCMGSDVQSIKSHISTISEAINRKSPVRYGLAEIINQMLLIADGRIGASDLLNHIDVSDKESSAARPLVFNRIYSTALSVRRRQGPMGKGWIIPLLEIRLIVRANGDLLLEENRVLYTFKEAGNTYTASDLPGHFIITNTTEYTYTTSEGLYFKFSKSSGLLMSRGIINTDEYIEIIYSAKRVTALADQSGNRIVFLYNAQNLIKSIRRENSAGFLQEEATYTYNAQNQLRTVQLGHNITQYEYSNEGDLTGVIYSFGSKQQISYDSVTGWFNGIHLIEDGSLTSNSNFTLRCDGSISVTSFPDDVTSVLYYGFGGVLVEQESPTSLPLSVVNDPKSSKEVLYVGDSFIASRSFHAETGVFIQTDANGDTMTRLLNNIGDTIRLSTERGVIHENNYTNGRLSDILFPDGSKESIEYNNDGLIRTRLLRDGSEIIYNFDDHDNVIQKTGNRGSVRYNYNSKNRITEIQGIDGTTKIEYDDNDLPVKITYPSSTELIYTYNNQQLRTSLSTNTGYYVRYNYDARNRLTSISDKDNKILTAFQYDERGILKKRVTGNGVSTNYGVENGNFRLSNLNITLSNGTILTGYKYIYDDLGYRISTETTSGNWNYKYDAAGQLITWDSPSGYGEEISYDENLNRITKKQKGRTIQTYESNKLGQTISFGKNEQFKYDKNGHMTEKVTNLGNTEDTEKFSFDQEGRITMTENKKNRCEYSYDSFGFIFKKSCANGKVIHYVVDPFGPFGSNVIIESSENDASFIYYANELGLVAESEQTSGKTKYFLYDGDGAVVHTVDNTGSISPLCTYDPFGLKLSGDKDDVKFGFLGQFGVRNFTEVKNMYMTRARIYDANHGRFISRDPLWPLVEPRNAYIYGKNNPVSYKDPNGEFAQILGGVVIGAVTGALVNAGSQALQIGLGGGSWSNFNWGDVGQAALGGGITGGAITSGAILGGVAGLAVTGTGGFISGAGNSIISDLRQGNSLDSNAAARAAKAGAIDGALAYIPWTWLGYKGKGAAGFGSKYMIPPKFTTSLDPRRATGNTMWKSLGAGNVIGEAAKKLGGWISDHIPTPNDLKEWGNDVKDLFDDVSDWVKDKWDDLGDWWDDFTDDLGDWWDDFTDDLDDWWDDFKDDVSDWGDDIADWWQDWIQSRDPNDIIGPTGYGDANFIAAGIYMDYKIRFENDENATAPAQKVTISCPIDDDLDPRTFRLGSFGFGDYRLELEYNSPIYQQYVNVTEKVGTFVYFQAGMNFMTKEAFWVLQSIDPQTGLPPRDPSIGFLPPNNKSTGSGEGFVTFRIQQKSDIVHGARIDARASIIFDMNPPIETPPIFNTIDRSWPEVSLLSDSQLTDSDGIVVNLVANDTGSGIKDFDIFRIQDTGIVEVIVRSVNQSRVRLPLAAGVKHNIVAIGTDHVGNVRPLDVDDFTEVFYLVSCLNNCSGNGICGDNGQCACNGGFHGEDCSSDSPIIDPPILDFGVVDGVEDRMLTMHLRARTIQALSDESSLHLEMSGYPAGSTFTSGKESSGKLVVTLDEFGDINMKPPQDYSGSFSVTLTAVLNDASQIVNRTGAKTINITPVTDIPSLTTTVGCYEIGKPAKLKVDAASADRDGSETVIVRAHNIPDNVVISGAIIDKGSAELMNKAHDIDIIGTFQEFTINITATAFETGTNDEKISASQVTVKQCKQPVSSSPSHGAAYFFLYFTVLLFF